MPRSAQGSQTPRGLAPRLLSGLLALFAPPGAAAFVLEAAPSTDLAPRKAVTVVMFDQNFRELFTCWARLFRASSSRPALDAVTLDDNASAFVEAWQREHPGELRAHQGPALGGSMPEAAQLAQRRGQRWSLRQTDGRSALALLSRWPPQNYMASFWPVMRRRLDDGEDVLHMDLDALPVGDVWGLLDLPELREADLVGTIDRWPPENNLTWGFALNTGVMLFRSTEPMREVVDHMIHIWATDDFIGTSGKKDGHLYNEQPMINQYLLERDCRWDCPAKFAGACGGRELSRKTFVTGMCGRLRVGVLPGREILRKGRSCGSAAACRGGGRVVVHTKNMQILQEVCETPRTQLYSVTGSASLFGVGVGQAMQRQKKRNR